MKTNLIGLFVATALVTSLSAFADDFGNDNYNPPGDDQAQAQQYDEPTQPAAVAYQNQGSGQYVTRPTQQWVPGRYEQVYQPNCPAGGPGFARCHSGRLVNRWVPGYYATVQQTVWVPVVVRAPHFVVRPGFGFHHRMPMARVGVRFGFH